MVKLVNDGVAFGEDFSIDYFVELVLSML